PGGRGAAPPSDPPVGLRPRTRPRWGRPAVRPLPVELRPAVAAAGGFAGPLIPGIGRAPPRSPPAERAAVQAAPGGRPHARRSPAGPQRRDHREIRRRPRDRNRSRGRLRSLTEGRRWSLVPAVGLGVAPCLARGAVAVLDVAQAPLDLGGRVGLPVGTGRGHLGTRQRLRDAVGVRAGVLGLVVPVALLLPQRLEAAAELVLAPAVVAPHRFGDGLGVAAGGGRGGVVAPGAGGVVGGALLLLLLGLGGAGGGNGSARLLDALLGLLALRGALVVGDVLHVGEEVLLAGLRGVSRHGRVRRVVGLHAAVGQRRDTEDGAGDDRGAPDCRGSAQRNPVGQQESPFRQSHAGK